MTRSIFQTAAFLAVAVTTAWAGPGLIAIPITLPVVARFLTAKKVPVPQCDLKMIWTKGNNFVCALPDIDWSDYGRVEVTAIEIAPTNLKKPLTERERQQLQSSLLESLRKQFGDSVNSGSGRTLKVRATVTEVRRTNNVLNIISLAAIQAPLSFGGASTRIELADGDSNKTLAQITVSSRARVYDVFSSAQRLGHAKKSLDRTSKQLNKDIQLLQSRFNTLQEASSHSTD
jgi:hypothetical protein